MNLIRATASAKKPILRERSKSPVVDTVKYEEIAYRADLRCKEMQKTVI